MWQREGVAASWREGEEPPETAGDVVLVDARPAVLVAQLTGPDGRPYLTSRSTRGSNVHEPLDDTTDRSSYRVTDLLTVDADRTSAFVATALDDGSFLVVAMNEGVVVTPHHFGVRRVPLAPHQAFIAGPDDQVGSGRLISPWTATPDEDAEVAGVLDRVAELMHGRPGALLASAAPPGPPARAASARATATARAGEADPTDTADNRFGRYFFEMLLTGAAITVVLVVILLVLG